MTIVQRDPATEEIIANRLESIVREMGDTILRTGRSIAVTSGRDFSCAIADGEGQLLAIGTSLPIHVLAMVSQMEELLRRFEGEIYPEDVFIGNDPFEGGSHLPDVMIGTPLFCDGKLTNFVLSRAHWLDVGGAAAGSMSGNLQEGFQEGMSIPILKIVERGEPAKSFWELLLHNTRTPLENRGDLTAQIAACQVGARRLGELYDRYGLQVALRAFQGLLDSTERRVRAKIREIPEGTYTYEGYLDNDGVRLEAKRIRVSVSVRDGEVSTDLSGSSPQCEGSTNSSLSSTIGFVLTGLKTVIDPEARINQGSFRPFSRVHATEGTLVHALPRAATAGGPVVGLTVLVAIAAMAEGLPDSVVAGGGTTSNALHVSGQRDRGGSQERFILFDYPCEGNGATSGLDGLDATRSIRSGNLNQQSIEVLEAAHPVIFRRYEIREDSGGAGKRRGGNAVIREFELLTNGRLSVISDGAIIPPFGLFGGHPGATMNWEVLRKGKARPIGPFRSKTNAFRLRKGDIVRAEAQGGGGYGDPLQREPELVRDDVQNGFVSVHKARETYGVMLDPVDLSIDVHQTNRVRASLRRRLVYVAVEPTKSLSLYRGMRVMRASPDLQDHGVGELDLVELVSPEHPGPLRGVVRFDSKVPAGTVRVDREAAEVWHLEGTRVELRRLGRFY